MAALIGGLLTLASAPAATAASTAAAPSAAAKSSGWRPTEVRSPAGSSFGNLAAIVCTSKSSCTAGGSFYAAAAKRGEPMVVTESSGRWAPAVTIRLPSNAATTDGSATIAGMTCPSRSGCVAVGNYGLPTNALQGFITSGHGKTWSKARTPELPTGSAPAENSYLTGVSCTKPGSCVAVGGYTTSASKVEAMAETESGGHWQRAVTIRPPTNAVANPAAHFAAVSCPKAGDCVAVGGYTSKSLGEAVMAAVEVRGKWERATQIRMPASSTAVPEAELYSVSCPSAGNCVATGFYTDTAGRGLPLVVTESHGRWQLAIGLTGLPAGAAKQNQSASLNAVTCSRSSCTAVGGFATTALLGEPMAVTEAHGRWSRAMEIPLPSHATRGSAQAATLFGLACRSATDCTGVGEYIDSAHITQAWAATRS